MQMNEKLPVCGGDSIITARFFRGGRAEMAPLFRPPSRSYPDPFGLSVIISSRIPIWASGAAGSPLKSILPRGMTHDAKAQCRCVPSGRCDSVKMFLSHKKSPCSLITTAGFPFFDPSLFLWDGVTYVLSSFCLSSSFLRFLVFLLVIPVTGEIPSPCTVWFSCDNVRYSGLG